MRALFTALATIGFRRLAETTEAFGREAPAGTLDHFTAIGRGYVTFAIENPAYFRLIFRSDSLDSDNPDLIAAGKAAFGVPVAAVGAYCGSADPMADPELVPLVIGLWSIVHGFSELLLSGQLDQARSRSGPEDAGGPAASRRSSRGSCPTCRRRDRASRNQKAAGQAGGTVIPGDPAANRRTPNSLGELKPDRLRALAHAVRLDLEGHPLTIGEVADAGGLERGHVDEDVLRAALGGDEAEAFRRIEELYGASLAHMGFLFPLVSFQGCDMHPFSVGSL